MTLHVVSVSEGRTSVKEIESDSKREEMRTACQQQKGELFSAGLISDVSLGKTLNSSVVSSLHMLPAESLLHLRSQVQHIITCSMKCWSLSYAQCVTSPNCCD